jgi:hypothetical protein
VEAHGLVHTDRGRAIGRRDLQERGWALGWQRCRFQPCLYLPASLDGRKDEVVAFLEEACFVEADGPVLPWFRGFRRELTEALLNSMPG